MHENIFFNALKEEEEFACLKFVKNFTEKFQIDIDQSTREKGLARKECDLDCNRITHDTSRINNVTRQISFGRGGRGYFGINAIELMTVCWRCTRALDRHGELKLGRACSRSQLNIAKIAGVICIWLVMQYNVRTLLYHGSTKRAFFFSLTEYRISISSIINCKLCWF